MRYIEDEGRIVWSASDLKAAAECEFAWLRAIDARLGRVPAVEEPEDATLERAGRLGDAHELRVLDEYASVSATRVVEIPETRSTDAEALAAAVAATNAALASDADVVYQAAFATPEFVGFADFLVRDDSGPGRRAPLDRAGHQARTPRPRDRAHAARRVRRPARPARDPAGRSRRAAPRRRHDEHARRRRPPPGLRAPPRAARARSSPTAGSISAARAAAIAWGDDRGDLAVVACGRCATCEAEVVASRDLLLVAGMRPVQRDAAARRRHRHDRRARRRRHAARRA